MCLSRLDNELCEEMKSGHEPLTFYKDKKIWRAINGCYHGDEVAKCYYQPGDDTLKADNAEEVTSSNETYTTGFHACTSLEDLAILGTINRYWKYEPIEVRVMPKDILHVGKEDFERWDPITVVVADKMVVVREIPENEWKSKLSDTVLKLVMERMDEWEA